MRALQDKVNIIPVVAKSDGLTYDEVKKKKSRVNKIVFQTLVRVTCLKLSPFPPVVYFTVQIFYLYYTFSL